MGAYLVRGPLDYYNGPVVRISPFVADTLAASTPTFTGAAIGTNGDWLTLTASEDLENGGGGVEITIASDGAAITGAFSSANSTTTSKVYVLSRTVDKDETLTYSYTQPGNGWQATDDGTDLATVTDAAITNNSTQDLTAPSGYTVSIDQSAINAANDTAFSFTFASAETGATYNYTVNSSGGGTEVTGTDTITTATDQISSIDVSGLADGTLTLSVTLTDSSGNEGTATTDTVSKDATLPTLSSASISGTTLTLTFAEAATRGASYVDSDWTLTPSGSAATLTYASGDGTSTWTLTVSRDITGETATLDWAGTANGVEDSAGNDLAAVSGLTVTFPSSALRGMVRDMVRDAVRDMFRDLAG